MQNQVIIVPSRMPPFEAYWLHPALSPKLTQLEKITLLCQSVSSSFCWVPSSALHALCSLGQHFPYIWLPLPTLTILKALTTHAFSIVITWHCFLLEQAAKLLQLPLHLILAPSADPIFHISGVTVLPTQSPASERSHLAKMTPILNQSPVISLLLQNPFQTYYCLLIPSNTDLRGSYNLLESNHFLLVYRIFPLKMYQSHIQPFWSISNPPHHSLLPWVTCFLMCRVKM